MVFLHEGGGGVCLTERTVVIIIIIVIITPPTKEPRNSGKRWLEKARLVDSRGTVQDIAFAPNHLGLKLVGDLVWYGVAHFSARTPP